MKKEIRIPTIIGFIFLILGTAGGVFLIQNRTFWLTRANSRFIPKEIRVTNISESGFSVSWITDEETVGFLKYGPNEDLSSVALDDRDQFSGKQDKFFTHHVTAKNLKPNTNYFFKISSGGRLFDNGGRPYEVKTGPLIKEELPPSDVAYGTILKEDGSPAEGVIVYLSLANATTLSTLTKYSGTWVIPLHLARLPDLSSWASYDKEASIEEIFVQGGKMGTATAIGVTKNDSPFPPITLGGSFDFQKAIISSTPTPTQPENLVSGFSVKENFSVSKSFTLINPSEGETINTTKPEILGTGPAGEVVTIVVNSSSPLTTQVTIDQEGNWRWSPPVDLSPGEHTVTVSLSNGQKITRSFVVLASGSNELPSFTSTPSATLVPSPTFSPTPTPSPTSILSPTPISTGSARVSSPSAEKTFHPGYLTPTLVFSIIGICTIFLGVFLRKGIEW